MSVDVTELEAELTQTRRKALDWVSAKCQQSSDLVEQHTAFMQDQTEKQKSLQGRKLQLEVAAGLVRKRLHDEMLELQHTEASMASAETSASTAEERLAAKKAELERVQEKFRQQVAELESRRQPKERHLESLRRARTLFGDRFGLRFRQGQDELCFVLTHIDELDCSKEFCVNIRVLDNIYQVTKCDPMVPGLQDLTEEVNRTNNLSAFLKAVRSGFVAIAKKARDQ